MKDRYSYVAVFDYAEDGMNIEFPDLKGCYPCADKDDTEMALKNAREALGIHIWGMEQDGEVLPLPTSIKDTVSDSRESKKQFMTYGNELKRMMKYLDRNNISDEDRQKKDAVR